LRVTTYLPPDRGDALRNLRRVTLAIPTERFCVALWIGPSADDTIKGDHFSHAARDPWFVERGFRSAPSPYTWPTFNGYNELHAVQRFFGVYGPDLLNLACCESDLAPLVTRDHVARNLDLLLAGQPAIPYGEMLAEEYLYVPYGYSDVSDD
jgi:hypothetical protein